MFVGVLLADDLGHFVDELEEVVAVAAVGEERAVGVAAGEPLLAACALAELVVVHRLDAETVAARLRARVGLAGLEELAGVLGDLLDQPAAGVAHLRRLAFVALGEPVGVPALKQRLLPLLLRPEAAVVAVQRVVARAHLAALAVPQAEERVPAAFGEGVAAAVEAFVQFGIGRRLPLRSALRCPHGHSPVYWS